MALAAVSETDPDKAEALMRGAYTLRRGDGTWVNTQANAFCMMGLQTYAGMQSDPVDLNIRAMFEQKEILSASFTENQILPQRRRFGWAKIRPGGKPRLILKRRGRDGIIIRRPCLIRRTSRSPSMPDWPSNADSLFGAATLSFPLTPLSF